MPGPGSWTIQQLSGHAPEADNYSRVILWSSTVTPPSYTIVSKSLTGLSKSIGFVFSPGQGKIERAVELDATNILLGANSLFKTAWPPWPEPYSGIRVVLFTGSFTGPSYTIVSVALTGLSKSIGFIFGYPGHIHFTTPVRKPGALAAFQVTMGLTVVWNVPNPAPSFSYNGALSVTWIPVLPAITFEYDGRLVVVWTGKSSAQFKYVGALDVKWTAFQGAKFTYAGHLDVIWMVSRGQKASCVTGDNTITAPGPEQEQNFVF